ncbi:MAG TPA: SDR family NAD(P)-dependent oxidoreductase [Pseudonocardiaceae bacterium]|nr:SDR family NAD(P)-dependent oxidoreductase [Pseudonocardiaceae bacterium]
MTALVALVAGALGSVGERSAIALADAGAAVSLLAAQPDQLDVTIKEIQTGGGTAIPIGCDVTDHRQTRQAVDRTVAELGRLDVVVSNIGLTLFAEIEDAQVEDWHRMLAVNLAGTLHLAHAAVPHLVAAASGDRGVADFIGIGSAASRDIEAGAAAHRATQDGLASYLAGLQQELAPRHVRVALLECDAVDPLPPPEARTHPHITNSPLLRPDDVADAVRYMATRPTGMSIAHLRVTGT